MAQAVRSMDIFEQAIDRNPGNVMSEAMSLLSIEELKGPLEIASMNNSKLLSSTMAKLIFTRGFA
eukprot:4008870-Alexandrium_andersonii.AAC.1